MDLLLDIEALGLRPGYAVVQVGAVEFDPMTGATGREFHAYLEALPTDLIDPETLAWHQREGSYPHPEGVDVFLPSLGLNDFRSWVLERIPLLGAVWSWGATYDFPLLEAAFLAHLGQRPPWFYWQAQCARTVWHLAFPGVKHDKRPHHALEDARAAASDLCAAIAKLTGREGPPA